jgi:hypothetical protein
VKLSDLVRDPGTGQLSHTKIWTNIAYFAATIAFIRMSWVGTITADMWLWYLGVVGTHSAISKLISLRYGGGANS